MIYLFTTLDFQINELGIYRQSKTPDKTLIALFNVKKV